MDGDQPVSLPRDAQRLVAFLAIRACRLPRTLVAGTLWIDHSTERAQGNLRSALWRVRQHVETLVISDANSLAISPETEIDVNQATEAAHRLFEAECTEADLAMQPFLAELLPGWYDEWAIIERERIRQQSLHALEAITGKLIEAGHHAAAAQAALFAIETDPLRESAHRCLIRVHLDEGNRSEALRQFTYYEKLVRNELGFGPSQKMIDLIS